MPFKSSLSKEDREFAQKDIGEYPDSIDAALTILKDRIALEPGLKANTDDAFLVRFLRARKYNINRAFSLLQTYYATKNEEVLQDLKPSSVKEVIDECVICAMDGYSPKDKTKIVVFRPGLWEPADVKFTFIAMIRCNMLVLEHLLRDEVVQVRGVRLVFDGSGVGWDHAKELARGGYPQKAAHILQNAMPLRLKGIHYINEPAMMGYIFNLIKPFMRDKLISRLNFNGTDLNKLHEQVPKEVLPAHLGGDLPILPYKHFQDALRNSEDYFVKMAEFYFDDPKVLFKGESGDAKDSGVSGTYKKLSVD